MENVVLIIHLLLALGLVAVVLLQRSEEGGLGMGSGGGGGATGGRSPATAMSKVTWALAVAFICTSITLTIIAAQNASGSSVIDRLGVTPPAAEDSDSGTAPLVPPGSELLPPSADDNTPLVPRAD